MLRVYSLFLLLLLALTALPVVAASRLSDSGATQADATTLPPAVIDREIMGMSIRDPWYEFNTNSDYPNAPNEAFQETMGTTLEQVGVRWVRLELHIPAAITSTDAISAEIAKNDYFINTVAPRHNLKVLALLSFGLLRGIDACGLNDPNSVSSRYGGGVNKYMDTWLTRALMIADRYQGQITAYEILNEENRLNQCSIPGVVNGKALNTVDPKIMGRLITKLYRFCHHIEPLPSDEPEHGCANARIILGGIHPRGSSAPGSSTTLLTDAQYLKAIYTDTTSFAAFKNDPKHPYYPVDGIAYHPYPEEIQISPQNVFVNYGLQRMRAALTLDPCKQFWVTEVGYNVGFDPDGPKNPRPPQTEEGQAAFMQDVYTSLAQRQLDQQLCGGATEIANVFWFKYEDFPGSPPQQWGIVHIPFIDGACPGGCYDPNGIPTLYRQSFAVYRALSGYRTYLPAITQ